MTNTKVGNRPKTPDKDPQIKLIKIIHFGTTTESVVNFATQQKKVKIM